MVIGEHKFVQHRGALRESSRECFATVGADIADGKPQLLDFPEEPDDDEFDGSDWEKLVNDENLPFDASDDPVQSLTPLSSHPSAIPLQPKIRREAVLPGSYIKFLC